MNAILSIKVCINYWVCKIDTLNIYNRIILTTLSHSSVNYHTIRFVQATCSPLYVKYSIKIFLFVVYDSVLSRLLGEHLLGCFLEVRATLIIKLLFCVGRSSLGLCILQRLLILLILIGSRRLLHSHHRSAVSTLPAVICHGTHSCVHSWVETSGSGSGNTALPWHHGRLYGSAGVLLNFRFFPYDIEHAILQRLFIFA